MSIIQGDNGTAWKLSVFDDAGAVDLSTAQLVTVNIKKPSGIVAKQATIMDATKGECEVVLTSTDTADAGIFAYQVTAVFNDGSSFSSGIGKLQIDGKLT